MIEDISSLLIEQLGEIQALLKKSNKNMIKYKDVPKKHIYISKCNGTYQYYEAINGERKYIAKKDVKNYTKYLQRDYEEKENRLLLKLEKSIKAFAKNYDVKAINNIYENYNDEKRNVIVPIVETDDMFISRWQSEMHGDQNKFYEKGNYKTRRGEYVRSKSEMIIADYFNEYGLDYVYEPELKLSEDNVIYPDFAILNVRKRKTVYWEHLGMIDDGEYASKNFNKLRAYERAGYTIGNNIVFSMESIEQPLDIEEIEKKIKEYCV